MTSSVVWLNEQGVDISLRRYQAYRTSAQETVVTVSQVYPVAEFEFGPRRKAAKEAVIELPETPWSVDDLRLLQTLPFEVVHALLDLCAERPGEWIGAAEGYERAGVEQKSGIGKLAGFGTSVRSRFKRSNPPWATAWRVGGLNQQYYRIDTLTAETWNTVQQESVEGAPDPDDDSPA